MFEPERFRNLELGAKWEVSPGLAASAALYRLVRSNVAVTDPDDVLRAILVDGQRSEGLELDINGRISGAWSIAGGYALHHGRLGQVAAGLGLNGGHALGLGGVGG